MMDSPVPFLDGFIFLFLPLSPFYFPHCSSGVLILFTCPSYVPPWSRRFFFSIYLASILDWVVACLSSYSTVFTFLVSAFCNWISEFLGFAFYFFQRSASSLLLWSYHLTRFFGGSFFRSPFAWFFGVLVSFDPYSPSPLARFRFSTLASYDAAFKAIGWYWI